ncbi:hypothetical protein HYH02_002685 [Chlamydomonas schloesseri]|uniref:Uncharacterized protein n=1 Tax=Chlamydomonas schloesseri TaxID=2026947 RepID=A0A835WR93_9CHLO|nr:hypothetical protein HYH02_002685 [Chlamydomonas schloesseri]|eukprot:KAG2452442.1 hypothetical protein HYH02_002685 [Chlamydomonas schloesseri]
MEPCGTHVPKQPCPAPAALLLEFGCGPFDDNAADLFTRHGSASSSDCGEDACISPALSTASSFWEEEGGAWPLADEQQPCVSSDCAEAVACTATQDAAAETSPKPVDQSSSSCCDGRDAVDVLMAQLAPLSLRTSANAAAAESAPPGEGFWGFPCGDGDSNDCSRSCPAATVGARVCRLQQGLVQQAVARGPSAFAWERTSVEEVRGAAGHGEEAEEEEGVPPEWLAHDMAALVGAVVCGALWQDDDSDEDDVHA